METGDDRRPSDVLSSKFEAVRPRKYRASLAALLLKDMVSISLEGHWERLDLEQLRTTNCSTRVSKYIDILFDHTDANFKVDIIIRWFKFQ